MTTIRLDAGSPDAEAFGSLTRQPADALLQLIGLHREDPREHKIDLGVGVYRDDRGATPVMRAVKAAERHLVAEQETKAYLGAEGDVGFTDRLAQIVFGIGAARSDRLTGVQTPGGTGALRLGAEIIARSHPGATVWIGVPTWPNHAPIFHEAGLAVRSHPYFDVAAGQVDFAAMMDALAEAAPGDIILLHGCCHNPTGADFSLEQWRSIADLVVSRGLLPFVDLAYQGLGDGLESDAAGLRTMLAAASSVFVAYSCDKNFGLYRERVGALWIQAPGGAAAALIRQNMLVLARNLWSMPPDHGAALVRLVLSNPALAADWRLELKIMRQRINELRSALAVSHPRLAPLSRQRGLFAMLPLSPEQVAVLRERDGIYMAASGRINIAGLRFDTVEKLAGALRPFLDR